VNPAMTRSNRGFTRLELLAAISAATLVCVAAMPLLGASTSVSKMAGCYNNLRQLGVGMRIWSNDHGDALPWVTPVSEGGTRPINSIPKTAVGWVEFLTFSNQLSSPRVLACPEDAATKVALNWTTGPAGFGNSGYRANALSYMLSFHGSVWFPRSVAVADRDIRVTATGSCSPGGATNVSVIGASDPQVTWTNAVHARAGHLLFMDGSVEFISSQSLIKAINGPQAEDGGTTHVLFPR
jgi:hypothetical protein